MTEKFKIGDTVQVAHPKEYNPAWVAAVKIVVATSGDDIAIRVNGNEPAWVFGGNYCVVKKQKNFWDD